MPSAKAKDFSWIADQMTTHLRNGMGAKLTSLQAEYADGIVLKAPISTGYFIGEPNKIPSFPFVAIIPESADVHASDGMYRNEIETVSMTIALVISAEDSPANVLRRLTRTMRALQEVIDTDPQLGVTDGTIVHTAVSGKSLGPLLLGDDALIQEGHLSITVTVAGA